MIFLRSHTFHHKRRRGSVIVLVVAVLALLAVIGTVYIVSSRAEKNSAAASSVAVSLNLAQQAVDRTIVEVIGRANVDATGVVGSYSPQGVLGFRDARWYDMPEINKYMGIASIGGADHNNAHRDQPWLVNSLYLAQNPVNFIHKVDGSHLRHNEMSLLTSAAFNPSTGAYDIPFYQPYNNTTNPPQTNSEQREQTYMHFFEVVAPNLQSVSLRLPTGVNSPARSDAFIQLLPISEPSGIRYRYGTRIIDASRMANLNVGMTYDFNTTGATAQQLNGTYFTGYNLASPDLFGSGGARGTGQSFFAGTDIDTSLQLVALPYGNLQNPGRLGSWTPAGAPTFNPLNFYGSLDFYWAQAAFRFESPYINGTLMPITPFDYTDELALRAYGALGTLSTPRSALAFGTNRVWPNILGNRDPNSTAPQVNMRRTHYTASSYSRDLRPFPDPANPFTLTPVGGWSAGNVPPDTSRVWPPFPAKVAALPEITPYAVTAPPLAVLPNTVSQPIASERLALAATNIASAMALVGGGGVGNFSPQEVRAFAANYLTYRWNGWQRATPTPVSFGTPSRDFYVYSMPNGPSFIDDVGICIRGENGYVRNFGGGANDLTSRNPIGAAPGRPGKVYLGYAGQPFINEVAVLMAPDATGAAMEISDYAIELYNPYNVAISLRDFDLNLEGVNQKVFDNAAFNAPAFQDWWIPPRGYYVITKTSAGLATTITNPNAKKLVFSDLDLTAGPMIYLTRKFLARNNTYQYGAVDYYDASEAAAPPAVASTEPIVQYASRSNDELPETDAGFLAHQGRWIATLHNAVDAKAMHFIPVSGIPAATTGRPTLGGPNEKVGTAIARPLYDRMLEFDDYTSATPFVTRTPLRNIADFNRIMRIGHEIDMAAGNPGVTATLAGEDTGKALSEQLYDRLMDTAATAPAVKDCPYPADAALYFDFRADPNLFDPAHGGIPGFTGYNRADVRAVWLLDMLTFTDRVSDFSINIGDNDAQHRGLSKIRIPGQINVNTASPEVLAMIPRLAKANTATSLGSGYIGAIMAYRLRTSTDDLRIPAGARPNSPVNFTGVPGYGIRSLAELLHVFNATDLANNITYTTMDARDQAWGAVLNYLTVRSDTFVVYSYLEAVRLNPRYTGAFNNSSDWYTDVVSDDPASNSPLIRVGRKRWISLVDRSFSNYNRVTSSGTPNYEYADPKIVASKDLPQ